MQHPALATIAYRQTSECMTIEVNAVTIVLSDHHKLQAQHCRRTSLDLNINYAESAQAQLEIQLGTTSTASSVIQLLSSELRCSLQIHPSMKLI